MKLHSRHYLIIGLAFLAACTEPTYQPPTSSSESANIVKQPLATPKERILGVANWAGVYRVTTRSSGVWNRDTGKFTWSDNLTYRAPMRVTMVPFLNMGLGTVAEGFYSLNSSYTSTIKDQITEANKGSCSRNSSPISTDRVIFPSDTTFQFRAFTSHWTMLECPAVATLLDQTYPSSVSGPVFPSLPPSFFTFPLPTENEPLHLKARMHFITIGDTVVQSVPPNPAWGEMPIEWEIEWDLWPEETDAELILSAEGYENWLPLGPTDIPPVSLNPSQLPAPGNTIKITAAIIPLVPTFTDSAESIEFEVDSSTLKGISMNKPLDAEDTSPQDLQFEEAPNTALNLEFVDKNRVKTPQGTYTHAFAELSAFDFGAYGTVKAIAHFPSGKVLLSKVVMSDGQSQFNVDSPLNIPKRDSQSQIADSWKQSKGAMNLADNSDLDKLPNGLGDEHAGDGLTLFEEYRGFHLKGNHTRTSPKEVDYFLNNNYGSSADPGINLFQNLTGLKVHKLDAGEFGGGTPPTRVLNVNSQEGTHIVDQHIVIMNRKAPDATDTFSKTIGGPSTPWKITSIELLNSINLSERASHIAHELAHSVNVPHHGDLGLMKVKWAKDPEDGKYYEVPLEAPGMVPVPTKQRIGLIHDEETRRTWTPSADITELILAVTCQGSESNSFSGEENCIMRRRANAVIRSSEPGTRYFINIDEPIGSALCASTEGSLFNRPVGWVYSSPEVTPPLFQSSRHGQAESSRQRGDCAHKICVSDAHKHPAAYGDIGEPTCNPVRSPSFSLVAEPHQEESR
ncbi:hypothetical protein [Corallococcus sp. EGB]|uniref:hypothetical protein n=1 Tax=Corallococcus sp. EGB TaxID=1521117 RepID=UPI001CBA8E46|nr:hypothetical protein [Corallococcus sp. EGB]